MLSQWEPFGQTVPPVSFIPTGWFIKYNVALCTIVAAALARGLQSGDKNPRAGTLLPSSLASPAPTGRHSARQPQPLRWFSQWAGWGGSLRSRGHVLTRRTGLSSYGRQ